MDSMQPISNGSPQLLANARQVLVNSDYTRVPYAVFSDRSIYEEERRTIFRGPVWNYLGLAVEIPKPGDYMLSYVGDIQVVVNRTPSGKLASFVNSCAHRGAQIVSRLRGHTDNNSHICPYHQWCFDMEGTLTGVPQQRGVKGKGGMDAAFDKSDHGLQTLRVEAYKGIIFGTFSQEAPSLLDYLGDKIRPEIDRIFDRPIRVLGYWRQDIPANWKLYFENIKDPYHGSLLHLYHTTFGIFRATMSGRVWMDDSRGNSVLRTADIGEDKAERDKLYATNEKWKPAMQLKDASMFDVTPDYDDKVNNMILSVFPSVMLGQVANTFQTRHVRPKAPDRFELYWTYLGFEGDDEKTHEGRLRQANFVGPAGYISLEDGEAGRLVQAGTESSPAALSVVEMGGRGPIQDQDTVSTEICVRGFWKRYEEIMRGAAHVG